MNKDFNISDFLSLDGYATDERKSRRKSNSDLEVSNTNEFYSPYEIVKKLCDKVSEDKWNDAFANFLEPSMGNGQFIVYIIYNKIMHGSTWEQALSHTWGVELMDDNVKETKERILNLFVSMGIDFDIGKANEIMAHNLVCSDFFKWDYENWRPIQEAVTPALF